VGDFGAPGNRLFAANQRFNKIRRTSLGFKGGCFIAFKNCSNNIALLTVMRSKSPGNIYPDFIIFHKDEKRKHKAQQVNHRFHQMPPLDR
jgi:hypothetical protein